MNGRYFLLLLASALLLVACGPGTAASGAATGSGATGTGTAGGSGATGTGAATMPPAVRIAAPQGGATLQGSVLEVTLTTENFTLMPAGGPVRPGEGHIHVTLDGTSLQMVSEQKVVYQNVASGQHTLVVELVNGDHSSLSPPIRTQITFTAVVGAAAPPTTPAPAATDPYAY